MARAPEGSRDVPAGQVEVVVEATRTVGALIAQTLARLEPSVTMPQWRVLVLASAEARPVSAVAEDLAIHPSNATRIVDRLVVAGLLERTRGTADRRQVLVSLTQSGRDLYEQAMGLRRARVQAAMRVMTVAEREQLVVALGVFTDALLHDPGPGQVPG